MRTLKHHSNLCTSIWSQGSCNKHRRLNGFRKKKKTSLHTFIVWSWRDDDEMRRYFVLFQLTKKWFMRRQHFHFYPQMCNSSQDGIWRSLWSIRQLGLGWENFVFFSISFFFPSCTPWENKFGLRFSEKDQLVCVCACVSLHRSIKFKSLSNSIWFEFDQCIAYRIAIVKIMNSMHVRCERWMEIIKFRRMKRERATSFVNFRSGISQLFSLSPHFFNGVSLYRSLNSITQMMMIGWSECVWFSSRRQQIIIIVW